MRFDNWRSQLSDLIKDWETVISPKNLPNSVQLPIAIHYQLDIWTSHLPITHPSSWPGQNQASFSSTVSICFACVSTLAGSLIVFVCLRTIICYWNDNINYQFCKKSKYWWSSWSFWDPRTNEENARLQSTESTKLFVNRKSRVGSQQVASMTWNSKNIICTHPMDTVLFVVVGHLQNLHEIIDATFKPQYIGVVFLDDLALLDSRSGIRDESVSSSMSRSKTASSMVRNSFFPFHFAYWSIVSVLVKH